MTFTTYRSYHILKTKQKRANYVQKRPLEEQQITHKSSTRERKKNDKIEKI